MYGRLAVTLGLVSMLAVVPCEANDDEFTGFNRTMDDRFQLVLGAYFLDADSTYRAVSQTRGTTDIGLEDLGLDDREVQPYAYGRVRFSKRWRLDLSYFGTDRTATQAASFPINLPGGTIPVGVTTRTKFKTDVYAARVGYSFVRSQRSEVGAGLGLYVADFDLGISADVAGGGPGNTVTISQAADVTAPLPTLSGYGAYAFTEKLSMEGRFAWFGIDYDKYSGQMWDVAATLDYRAFDHVGIGVGYAYWDVDLDVKDTGKEDQYRIDFRGPLLYLRAGF